MSGKFPEKRARMRRQALDDVGGLVSPLVCLVCI